MNLIDLRVAVLSKKKVEGHQHVKERGYEIKTFFFLPPQMFHQISTHDECRIATHYVLTSTIQTLA